MTGVDIERVAELYQAKRLPPSAVAARLGTTSREVIRILRERAIPIRRSGRQAGWRKLAPEEIARRIAIGRRCRTWKEYRAGLGLPANYNARFDGRLYGVRLACFRCFPKRVSVGFGYVEGLRRPLCGVCLRRKAPRSK